MYHVPVLPVLLGVFAFGTTGPQTADLFVPTPEPAQESELSCFLQGATPEEAAERTSPLRTLKFSFEGGEALLCYSAPSVRGREIMGKLVPFGEPWRTGANEPSAIHLSGPLTVGGVELEAGSYAIYTVPGEEEWQFFLNSAYERWGIPITDAVRATEVGSFSVTPGKTEKMIEMLTFSHDDGAIVMEWENTRLEIPLGK
jgi:hypothetical protein